MTYEPVTVAARRALLDALDALGAHRDGLVLVGAQAIYLYTGDADVAVATVTKDSDVAVIPALIADAPTLEDAMQTGGFRHDPVLHQPGVWVASVGDDSPVELLVPDALHEGGGRRGARIPPHSKHSARTVVGLEAAAVSHRPMTLVSLELEIDDREIEVLVASAAALVVAKSYKLGERAADNRGRLIDKDAHDLYRLLRATSQQETADELARLLADDVSANVTAQALAWLAELTATPGSLVPHMAGRVEQLLGSPEEVAQSTWALVQDLVDRLPADWRTRPI